MKWRLWIPGVAAAVLLAMPCSGQAQTARVRLATKEVSLGKVHPGIYPPSLTVSPDSRRVAYGTRSGSKQFVVVDGAESIPVSYPNFVEDMKKLGAQIKVE